MYEDMAAPSLETETLKTVHLSVLVDLLTSLENSLPDNTVLNMAKKGKKVCVGGWVGGGGI